MNSRKCNVCNIDVHRESYVKDLKSKKHIENEMIVPEWLVQEPIEDENKNMYSPKPLKQRARVIFKLNDKQLKQELPLKVITPSYFTDRILKMGLKII